MSKHETREYELVYIIRPDMDEQALTDFNDRMMQTIISEGGDVQAIELWGKRALAYPINNAFQGHYVLQRFQTANPDNDEVDRLLRYSEDVLRYMLLRTDA